MSSTELLEAASISITSSEVASAIARQDSQVPHGVTVGPWTQFSDAARIFAIDVLPVPREPTNKYAWCTRSCSIALRSVRTTCSWPTTSANVRGRWRRYREAEAGGTEGESSPRLRRLSWVRKVDRAPSVEAGSPSAFAALRSGTGDPASP